MFPGFFLAWTALAASPTDGAPTREPDGAWVAALTLPAPVERVRALLADPMRASTFAPDVRGIRYVSRGTCDTLHLDVGPAFFPIAYDVERCPTPDGWHETLTGTGDLAVFDLSWRLTPIQSGTRLDYRLKIEPGFAVPEAIFQAEARRTVEGVLGRIRQAVTEG